MGQGPKNNSFFHNLTRVFTIVGHQKFLILFRALVELYVPTLLKLNLDKICAMQWFSNFIVHQNLLKGLLKHRLIGLNLVYR